MTKVEPTLEVNPSEEGAELELEPQESTTPEGDDDTEGQGGDPLDTIEDIDALRAEAKKYRGISQRHTKVKATPKEIAKPEVEDKPVQAQTPTDFLTKTDFYKSNERKAIRLATVVGEEDSDTAKQFKSDMLDNWNDVVSLYTPRKGKETPEDIYEDIRDAYLLFRAKTPKETKDDSALELSTTPTTIKSNRTLKSKETKTDDDERFSTPKRPDNWYPQKS